MNFPAGSDPRGIVAGEFNGDNNPDIAVANFGANTISVLLGDGAGNFGVPTALPAPGASFSLVTTDFNRDGHADLASSEDFGSSIGIMFGNGTGGFGPVSNFPVGQYPGQVVVADFNLNGAIDAASANSGTNDVSVILQQLRSFRWHLHTHNCFPGYRHANRYSNSYSGSNRHGYQNSNLSLYRHRHAFSNKRCQRNSYLYPNCDSGTTQYNCHIVYFDDHSDPYLHLSNHSHTNRYLNSYSLHHLIQRCAFRQHLLHLHSVSSLPSKSSQATPTGPSALETKSPGDR